MAQIQIVIFLMVMRDHITRQDDAESPGGRAKLRLSRGFPRRLAYDVTPYEVSRPIDQDS